MLYDVNFKILDETIFYLTDSSIKDIAIAYNEKIKQIKSLETENYELKKKVISILEKKSSISYDF